MNDQNFEAFGLAEPLMRAIQDRAYATPTPIQVQAMPQQITGGDLLALAETGSGKTAAFVLPVLDQLAKSPINPNAREVVTLVLAPTRELALQIDAEIAALSRHMQIRRAVVLGGVGKFPQINALKRGVHILVATPGRLLDLVSERHADLRSVRTLILDEADRMFDMGFIRDIRKIVSMLPRKRRTALFSATMPDEIRALANELLTEPARVDLSPKQIVVDRIEQKVMMVRANEKQSRLHTILGDASASRVIVFTRTKRGADRVADRLGMAGFGAAAIHGNKAQNARQRALHDFSAGHVRVLVATDIAARGIDVSNVTHVINFDMPVEPETYVHRIGRTARKGESGIAISLCDPAERPEITAIERLMKQKITVIDDVGGEALPMPERRPHHTHEAPRREGAHRKGPSRPRNGGERDRNARSDRGERNGHNGGARRDSQERHQHGAEARGNQAARGPRRDERGADRREDRAEARSEGRQDTRKAWHPNDRQDRDRGNESNSGRTPGREHRGKSHGSHAGHSAHGGHNAAGAGQPANSKAQHNGRPHRGGQPSGTRNEGGRDGSWNGQQPPKFLKQRGNNRAYGRPNGKPAA